MPVPSDGVIKTAPTALESGLAVREQKLQQNLQQAGEDAGQRADALQKLITHYQDIVNRANLGMLDKGAAAEAVSKIEDAQKSLLDANRGVVRAQIDTVQASIDQLDPNASDHTLKLQELGLQKAALLAKEADL